MIEKSLFGLNNNITFPGSLCGLGIFWKHLFRERLCRIEFYMKKKTKQQKPCFEKKCDCKSHQIYGIQNTLRSNGTSTKAYKLSALPSSLVLLCCRMGTCHWSMCRCHSDSAFSPELSLLPLQWVRHNYVVVSLWSLVEGRRMAWMGAYLVLFLVLAFSPLVLSLSGDCSFPAAGASRCWSNWNPALTSWSRKLLQCRNNEV